MTFHNQRRRWPLLFACAAVVGPLNLLLAPLARNLLGIHPPAKRNIHRKEYPNEVLESTQPRMIMAARLGFVILIFNVILRVFESQREKAELAYQNLSLQAENLKFQVDTLKQQINPHFLFNSLNKKCGLICCFRVST